MRRFRWFLTSLVLSASLLGYSGLAQADSEVVFNPANGHYYQRIDGEITWSDAKVAAESLNYSGSSGHLATISSDEERDFIVNNLGGIGILGGSGFLRGYWLGGFQPAGSPEPNGNWQWVTGEPWLYENWCGTEPNNWAGGEEDSLQFCGQDVPVGWNDINHASLTDGYVVEYGGAVINAQVSDATPHQGDLVCVDVNVTNVENLYSASFDLTYDPTVLNYAGPVTEGSFLNADDPVNNLTSLQADFYNENESTGKLVVGLSRLGNLPGVDGSGNLMRICFNVIGGYCTSSNIGFDGKVLEGPLQGSDISAGWQGGFLVVTLDPPANLAAIDPGIHTQVNLSWDSSTGATAYNIYRKNRPEDAFVLIGNSFGLNYEDTTCVLPTLDYYYEIRATANNGECVSDPSAQLVTSIGGLLGDINNDGRVNGKDLSRLGRSFGTYNECRADLNRDNIVDGEDLVLLGLDFGKTL